MALISLKNVSLGIGGRLFLDGIDLYVQSGEWIDLLRRNRMRKTSLLKPVCGEILPESGQVSRQKNLRVASLPRKFRLAWQGSLSGTVIKVYKTSK